MHVFIIAQFEIPYKIVPKGTSNVFILQRQHQEQTGGMKNQ